MAHADWPIGYGLVNHWADVDPVRGARLLKRARMTVTLIEWVPWFDVPDPPCRCKKTGEQPYYGGCASKPRVKEAQRFVTEMHKRGVAVWVVQENRNSCACRAQDDAYRRSMLKKILKLQEFGVIWYQPFSEPWVASPGTEAFARYARSVVPPHVAFVVPDKQRHVPAKQPYWPSFVHPEYTYLDVHPNNDEAVMAGLRAGHPMLVNSDCTGTLNPGPVRARRWARESARTKTGLHIYDFKGTDWDEEVIAVCGEEIKAVLGS